MPYKLLQFNIILFLRAQVQLHGTEHLVPEPFILAANHQSWIDSALIIASLNRFLHHRLHFIAASRKYNFLGTIPIDSEHKDWTIRRALEVLAGGEAVGIFPEGNSNDALTLRHGKTGVARLALATGLPVLPLGVKGPTGVTFWHATWNFFTHYRPWHFTIGEPLRFDKVPEAQWTKELLQTTTDRIMAAIAPLSGKPTAPLT
jgi:1-acyl-sn-glycerol-3-phosphate acyltransferase